MNTKESKLEQYWQLLAHLDTDIKQALIERLSKSIKGKEEYQTSIEQAYGAWESEESAEELINEIRSSRTFNRKTEEL